MVAKSVALITQFLALCPVTGYTTYVPAKGPLWTRTRDYHHCFQNY